VRLQPNKNMTCSNEHLSKSVPGVLCSHPGGQFDSLAFESKYEGDESWFGDVEQSAASSVRLSAHAEVSASYRSSLTLSNCPFLVSLGSRDARYQFPGAEKLPCFYSISFPKSLKCHLH